MHQLRIEPNKHGVHVFLDDFELQSVLKYKLEQKPGFPEFTVTLLLSSTPNVLIDNGRDNERVAR